MTKVKKTKKPKARKAIKKPVTKAKKAEASVRKIDKRLQPTPHPKVESIDKKINNPMLITDVPRSLLPQNQVPLQMFSGQDSGIFNRQLDVLKSKEQQLESKLLEFKKEFYNKEKEVKELQDLNAIQMLGQETENLKTNWSNEDYNFLKTQINGMLDVNLTKGNLDLLIDLKSHLKSIKNKHDVEQAEASMPSDIFSRFKGIFSKKETKTLLDDEIVDNDLVDEANEARSKIRVSNINLLDDEIYDNELMDNKQILSSEMDDIFGNI